MNVFKKVIRVLWISTLPALTLPVIGWLAAQGMTERIDELWEFTTAMIHATAASTFAVILGLSMLTNVIIICARHRDAPRGLTHFFPIAYLALIVSTVAWIVVIRDAAASITLLELVSGAVICTSSIAVFLFALLPDSAARARRGARLAMSWQARGRRSLRTLRTLAAVSLVVTSAIQIGLVSAGAVSQFSTVVYEDCDIQSSGWMGSGDGATNFIESSKCGSFEGVGRPSDFASSSSDGRVDIVSRGFRFGFPPVREMVEVRG
jgi:hypothetical protein